VGNRKVDVAVFLLMAGGASAVHAADAAVACEALKGRAFEQTTITAAQAVAAGAFVPLEAALPGPPPPDYSKLPAFCRVQGSIRPTSDSDVRFEVWLPAQGWNGKFVQAGNGGAAGAIVHRSLAEVLARGYAVANTDTGHQGGGGDFSWAVGQPEKFTDYAWRAVHVLTGVGKSITTAHYGRKPSKSYWYGCSTGGRQGLKEAQRFPEDYDGIVAGAPASNWGPLMSLSIHVQQNMGGPQGLGVDKLGLLKEAAIAACDGRDGVTDRVITDPRRCDFDPAMLACKAGETANCLAPAEVEAARRIHAGVKGAQGKVYFPGTGPASEPLWAMYASPQFGIGTSYFRHVVAKDPGWDVNSFQVDRDVPRVIASSGEAVAMDPDLSAFVKRGGKLITYHGTIDGLIPFANSVDYYQSVAGKLGARMTASGIRFYAVPGMDHCSGGEGAFQVDWLGSLDQWVETGRAPDVLPGAHPGPGTAFTRPTCPWPQLPKYAGRGEVTDAANFTCSVP
jgi:feruloyl esterase